MWSTVSRRLSLVTVSGGEVDVFHVGAVDFEHPKAGVKIFDALFVGKLLFNFLAGAADSLLADVGDGFVARFVGFAFGVGGFWQLHHNKVAITAVFGVELHHGMGGGGGAGEEVEDDVVILCSQT